jgi:hypothetical protein
MGVTVFRAWLTRRVNDDEVTLLSHVAATRVLLLDRHARRFTILSRWPLSDLCVTRRDDPGTLSASSALEPPPYHLVTASSAHDLEAGLWKERRTNRNATAILRSETVWMTSPPHPRSSKCCDLRCRCYSPHRDERLLTRLVTAS